MPQPSWALSTSPSWSYPGTWMNSPLQSKWRDRQRLYVAPASSSITALAMASTGRNPHALPLTSRRSSRVLFRSEIQLPKEEDDMTLQEILKEYHSALDEF